MGHVWQQCKDTLKRFQIYNAFGKDVRLKFYKHNDAAWKWVTAVPFMDIELKSGTYLTVDLTNGCAIHKKAYDLVPECNKKDPASARACEQILMDCGEKGACRVPGLGETRVNSVSCEKVVFGAGKWHAASSGYHDVYSHKVRRAQMWSG